MTIANVSRRGFLQGMVSAGALVLCVRVLPKGLLTQTKSAFATHADQATLHASV